jgi:alcohol dehydrogenase (cytochrome c)
VLRQCVGRTLKSSQRITAILVLLAVVILTAGAWFAVRLEARLPTVDAGHKVWWRVELFGRKAIGGVPELSWYELWRMAAHEGGFGLERFVAWGSSLNYAVGNPYNTEEDLEAGERMFVARCSVCHGSQGVGGGIGPALNHPGSEHGDSALSIYKTLRDGIKGTPMVPPGVSFTERWQLVSYVQSLKTSAAHRVPRPVLHIELSSDRLQKAGSRTDEWLTYSGSFDGHRYTPLAEIDRTNVARLRTLWVQQFEFNEPDAIIEATPLVVDNTIFLALPPSSVVAVDARTGQEIWRYTRPIPMKAITCCGRYNRGVAILGRRLFLNTIDAHVIALDANTGQVLWDQLMADNSDGYAMTGAPLIAGGAVVVGVSGGDLGIRGWLAALDPVSGHELWRFNSIPGPGEPFHETWPGDSWKTGGGATWVTGSYDPDLDLVYWGIGNPAPDYSADTRPGDNLYSNSVVALHPGTGKLAWHFQFTPHDEHDWDSNQTPILTDLVIGGVKHKVICWFNRNGFYYVIDRTNGEFLAGVPFVEQNWADGLDAKGRPIPSASNHPTPKGQLTKPAYSGGTNWQNAALDPKRNLVFILAMEGASVFTKSVQRAQRDPYDHATPFLASGAATPYVPKLVVRALKAATGERVWENYSPPLDASYHSGLLATGGSLVFGVEAGYGFAMDSETGHELWRLHLGGSTQSAPISFTLDGKQVLAFVAGRAMFLFGL